MKGYKWHKSQRILQMFVCDRLNSFDKSNNKTLSDLAFTSLNFRWRLLTFSRVIRCKLKTTLQV